MCVCVCVCVCDLHEGLSRSLSSQWDGQEGSDLTEVNTECDDEQNFEENLVIVDEADEEMDTAHMEQSLNDTHFQTKHATEIAQVLGTSEELKEFDGLRHQRIHAKLQKRINDSISICCKSHN